MNTKTVTCPNCFEELDTPASLEGKEVQCPLCQKNFVVKFITKDRSENEQNKNTSQFKNTEKSGLKIVKKKTSFFQGNKVGFLPISLVVLILLLMLGNVLLFFSMQQYQENIQKIERQFNALQMNVNSIAELSVKNQKAITVLFDRNQRAFNKITDLFEENQRTLNKIEQNILILTSPSAYEYQCLNFDRDQRYAFDLILKKLADGGWEYVGVLTNNGMNSKEILFRRKQQR